MDKVRPMNARAAEEMNGYGGGKRNEERGRKSAKQGVGNASHKLRCPMGTPINRAAWSRLTEKGQSQFILF